MIKVIAIAIPMLMFAGWLIHMGICWHWNFYAWYHDSDEDI